jgi:hypothetical protein
MDGTRACGPQPERATGSPLMDRSGVVPLCCNKTRSRPFLDCGPCTTTATVYPVTSGIVLTRALLTCNPPPIHPHCLPGPCARRDGPGMRSSGSVNRGWEGSQGGPHDSNSRVMQRWDAP